MRILGTKPSPVIRSQKESILKMWKRDVSEVSKEADAKRDGAINPKDYDFN